MEKYYSVVTTSGEYEVIASSIQIKDGRIYFNGPDGSTKRTVKEDEVVTIKPTTKVYSKFSKGCGAVAGFYSVYWTKKAFTKMANDLCPSENPLIQGVWKASTWAGAFGLGCIASKMTADAVEETIQPACDAVTYMYNTIKHVKEEVNNKKKENMKEVFEENPNNN